MVSNGHIDFVSQLLINWISDLDNIDELGLLRLLGQEDVRAHGQAEFLHVSKVYVFSALLFVFALFYLKNIED